MQRHRLRERLCCRGILESLCEVVLVAHALERRVVEGEQSSAPAHRVALARVKRATSQLARWHTEYENALTDAHDLGVPDGTLPTPPSNPGVGHTARVVDVEGPDTSQKDREPVPGASGEGLGFKEL